jgi:ABC-2 type transport system ATP-binding protein
MIGTLGPSRTHMSIKVKEVTKIYGEQRALDSVSFNIDSGEVVGFLGPNGAGKSTMMKIISCFIPQTSGQVSVCGYDVSEKSMEVRKRVGYLPEHNPLYLDMYVVEYLRFIGGLHKISGLKNRIEEMIDMVGLGNEQHKLIGKLSKGYRQRVGLAQAIIHDPEVLILDEPTSGLDPNQLVEIRGLITEIGKQKTVMLSTHIMQEVEAICSRVIIINNGKIVADQKANELRSSLGTSGYELRVEFSDILEEGVLESIPGVSHISRQSDREWLLHVESETDIRSQLFDWAVEKNISILTIQRIEKSLEDVFKQLTND